MVATFADDTAVLGSSPSPHTASLYVQENLDKIEKWLDKWRIQSNEKKSVHVTFTTRKGNCDSVRLNNQVIQHAESAKYLGLHLDRRLTWRKHIWEKRKQLGAKVTKYYWLIGTKSKLSTKNKLLIYKSILKPVWTYGIQLWGSASNSNIGMIERFQSKVLRMVTNAPWYVPNDIISTDLNMPSVKEEIFLYSKKYQARLSKHPNRLATNLLIPEVTRRLKRNKPLDLPDRFCQEVKRRKIN